MVLDPFSDVFRFDQRKNTRRGVLRVEAPDVLVEDIKLVDARTFNFTTRSKSITYRNIKALSSMMCSDGVTCGGSNFRVEGAWLYVGDNAFVISGVKVHSYEMLLWERHAMPYSPRVLTRMWFLKISMFFAQMRDL
jgi:hypothetical protein